MARRVSNSKFLSQNISFLMASAKSQIQHLPQFYLPVVSNDIKKFCDWYVFSADALAFAVELKGSLLTSKLTCTCICYSSSFEQQNYEIYQFKVSFLSTRRVMLLIQHDTPMLRAKEFLRIRTVTNLTFQVRTNTCICWVFETDNVYEPILWHSHSILQKASRQLW